MSIAGKPDFDGIGRRAGLSKKKVDKLIIFPTLLCEKWGRKGMEVGSHLPRPKFEQSVGPLTESPS